ncbi:unnamed protein product [Cuscuta epithymum]|uniref:Uncharacterized protein n=1 Tax=Cuscuta epithymum TaxID=186058 RepID=A0AAV0GCS5_9ASTE|nr:unnamed protein product [Cuscuta epithymum]
MAGFSSFGFGGFEKETAGYRYSSSADEIDDQLESEKRCDYWEQQFCQVSHTQSERAAVKTDMEEMIIKCDNMILEGDEDDLFLDEEVTGEEEAPNRSLRAKEDEEVLIRPPPEPPPRMMLEAGIRFRCQFSLFNFVLLSLSFFDMTSSVVVAFCIVVFSQTLTLGRGDGGFALATFGSFRPIIGQANHIALYRVIGSPASPRVGGWKYFLCRLYPLLNVLLSI